MADGVAKEDLAESVGSWEEDEDMEEGEGERNTSPHHVSDSDQVGELSFEDVEMEYR